MNNNDLYIKKYLEIIYEESKIALMDDTKITVSIDLKNDKFKQIDSSLKNANTIESFLKSIKSLKNIVSKIFTNEKQSKKSSKNENDDVNVKVVNKK